MTSKVQGSLVGVDGNAFYILSYFRKLAHKQGLDGQWTNDIINEAKKGDYNHLVKTISDNMTMETE